MRKIDVFVDFMLLFLIASNLTPVLAGFARFITLGLIVILFAIVLYKRKRGSLNFSYATEFCPLWMNMFGLYVLISAGWALNVNYALYEFVRYEKNAILITLFYVYYRSQNDCFERIHKVVEYSGVVIVFIYVCFVGIDQLREFAEGETRLEVVDSENQVLMNINIIACVLSFINVYILTSFIENGFKIRHLAIIPSLILIFLTGSRKGFVGNYIVFFLIVMLSLKKYKRATQYFLLLFLVLFSLTLISSFYSKGITKLTDSRMEVLLEGSDDSTTSRIDMAKLGWNIFLRNPLVGCGMGCPRVINVKTFGWDCYLHNDCLEILAGGGIVGFILYYLSFTVIGFSIFKELLRSNNLIPIYSFLACFSSFFLVILFKLGSVTYYDTEQMLFSLPLFLCYGFLRERRSLQRRRR